MHIQACTCTSPLCSDAVHSLYVHASLCAHLLAVRTMVFQQANKLISYQKKFAAHLQQLQKNKSLPAGKPYRDESATVADTSRYARAKTPVAT